MIDKRTLHKSKEIQLTVPDEEFSENFISALHNICIKYESLQSAYLVLKKEDDDICFLFGFQFDESHQETDRLLENMMSNILDLFEENMAFEGVCLSKNTNLKRAIDEITEPFFKR